MYRPCFAHVAQHPGSHLHEPSGGTSAPMTAPTAQSCARAFAEKHAPAAAPDGSAQAQELQLLLQPPDPALLAPCRLPPVESVIPLQPRLSHLHPPSYIHLYDHRLSPAGVHSASSSCSNWAPFFAVNPAAAKRSHGLPTTCICSCSPPCFAEARPSGHRTIPLSLTFRTSCGDGDSLGGITTCTRLGEAGCRVAHSDVGGAG